MMALGIMLFWYQATVDVVGAANAATFVVTPYRQASLGIVTALSILIIPAALLVLLLTVLGIVLFQQQPQ